MNRRAWLAAGVGVVALGAGIGVAWRRTERDPAASLWSLRFDRPGGGTLELATFKGRPLLLNFWATWCPPCVTEMPLLSDFYRQQRGARWQVVGIAVDREEAVIKFLAARPVAFPVVLAGASGVELTRKFGNRAGGLPFSVLLGRDGKLAKQHLGALDKDRLASWTKVVG